MISVKTLLIVSAICFVVGTWVGMLIMAVISINKCEECNNGDEQQKKR